MARPSIRAGSLTDLSLGTGGTPSVDAPEASEGELIVIFLALEGGGTVTHPEGFQSLLALDVAGNMSGHIIGKIAGAEEPASYTFSLGGTVDQWGAQACVMDDVDISNFPTSAVAGTSKANETSNVSSVTVPGMTLPADCLLIGHVASRVSNGTISSDGGVMTPLWDTWDMGDRSARSFQEAPSAGPTGDRTFAHSSSTLITAGLLALAGTVSAGTDQELDGVASEVASVATPGTLTATSPAIRVDDVLQDTDTGDLIDIESAEVVVLGGTPGSRTIVTQNATFEVADGVVEIPGAYTLDAEYLVALVESSERMSILPATVVDRNA